MRRVLFIENHDSFSWNLIDALPLPREQIEVRGAHQALDALGGVDAVVMGPGPTDPQRAGLIDLVHEVARRKLPFLGVCLGHQALGLAFGAQLVRSLPSHGKRATAHFRRSRLFPTIEGEVEVMRYHSLSLRSVRSPLREIASLGDQTVMAVEHESLPMAGLQFHPDSFGTPRGRELLASFFPLPARGERARVRGARAPTNPVLETVNLSSFQNRTDFALLGPGYANHGGWTLLENLSPDESCKAALWFASAQTQGAQAIRLGGRARAVSLVFDTPAAPLDVDLDEGGFLEGVKDIRERIAAGDVYQVNLTLRAELRGVQDGAGLLTNLCRTAVPRFAAWVKSRALGELVCASPELLFESQDGRIHVEPMKGTAAAHQRLWLEHSDKDKAELAMITDLLRDDLHRLCEPGSVAVTNQRRMIELPYVVQAVADVEGELQQGVSTRNILAVVHPGGSVTGAPREAALRCIQDLEATPRGAYCGALGLELDDAIRFALLIRTAQRLDTGWRYGVGAGITWDSDPRSELEEVRLKLGALTVSQHPTR